VVLYLIGGLAMKTSDEMKMFMGDNYDSLTGSMTSIGIDVYELLKECIPKVEAMEKAYEESIKIIKKEYDNHIKANVIGYEWNKKALDIIKKSKELL